MRLAEESSSNAPIWAVRAVFQDVQAPDLERERRLGHWIVPGSPSFDPRVSPEVKVVITPSLVFTTIPDLAGDEPFDHEVEEVVVPGFGFAFDARHWAELERRATHAASRAVDAIRQEMERQTDHRRRPAALRRQFEDIEILFRWLFHRERPPDRATRQRMRRLCDRLGIAYPATAGRLHDK
jgi:hypothetical protein